jgi:D-lactate dehydrogenase
MLMAVRLDTFPKTERAGVFYIGSNDPSELGTIRRHMLARFSSLPISVEYLHRVAFDIAEKYGKDMFFVVNHLGTGWLPLLFAIMRRVDAFCEHLSFLPTHLSDKIMQVLSSLFPRHLPKRMRDYRQRFEHHLILQMGNDGIEETSRYLNSIFPSESGDFFTCTEEEGKKALLHRFVAAGAAVRYRAVHARDVEDIVALDIALRRNDEQWFEHLPSDIEAKLLHKLYYGHFFCYVFHQDYIVAKGNDCQAIEETMWGLLDKRGAEYPAEHNVGHLYHARPALIEHYRSLDPCNAFNPGIGRTTKCLNWNAGSKPN